MTELLHTLGICPDHLAHLNLLDFLIASEIRIMIWYFEIKYLILIKLKKYAKKQ